MSKPFYTLLITAATLLLLSGCGNNRSLPYKKEYTYHGIYFGKHLSSAFKDGIRDGCETSRGIYTKSHQRFNTDIEYYYGWFRGRNKCRHLLQIDENDNLILN